MSPPQDVKFILLDFGLIAVVSTVTAFITAKAITALISELIDLFGSIGWGIAGLIAGSATGILGVGWAYYCDDIYRHQNR